MHAVAGQAGAPQKLTLSSNPRIPSPQSQPRVARPPAFLAKCRAESLPNTASDEYRVRTREANRAPELWTVAGNNASARIRCHTSIIKAFSVHGISRTSKHHPARTLTMRDAHWRLRRGSCPHPHDSAPHRTAQPSKQITTAVCVHDRDSLWRIHHAMPLPPRAVLPISRRGLSSRVSALQGTSSMRNYSIRTRTRTSVAWCCPTFTMYRNQLQCQLLLTELT